MKVVGIPGGILKFEEKTRIFKGVDAKSEKYQGGHDRIDWKSRGSTSKKMISSTAQQGGGTILFWKILMFNKYVCFAIYIVETD